MQQFLALTIAGLATYGCAYALLAMGLVVTYTTSGIFNFAQGAIGMFCAFVYWQFTVPFGWPSWAAFIFVAFLVAPLGGITIERLLMRRLERASLEAKLTVTVGLLLFLLAVAEWIWNPQTGREVAPFFSGDQVTIGGVTLTYQQVTVVIIAVVVAAALRLFFYRTRPGIATRAVVDNRDLAGLTGARPPRYSMLGWAMGSSLAAIAGIMLAPTVNLDAAILTLLVVNAYAAAVVGRLRSLPMTFAGALLLGAIQSYGIGYLPVTTFWSAFSLIIPMVFLFVAILVVPQPRAALARVSQLVPPRVAGRTESFVTAAVFIILAVVAGRFLPGSALNYADRGVAISIIMLSLLLLTGYGGQVSLCQLTFAGLGAYAMAKIGGSSGSLLGLLAAVGLAGAVGALVSLPAIRLRGLYLALATLAFAYSMDQVFFSNITFFGQSDALNVARPHIPGVSMISNRSYFVFLAVLFALLGLGILALRRSPFGRRLLAINASPAASLTSGVRVNWTKLVVFALSAGLAGVGGALYGGAQGVVSGGDSGDFTYILSLTVLLLAVVWGIRTVGGMFLAGISLGIAPLLQSHLAIWWKGAPNNILSLLVGLAAIGVAQNPEGTFGANTPLQKWRDRRLASQSPNEVEPEVLVRSETSAAS
jgi:branched-chain amino acid transport system permease protein